MKSQNNIVVLNGKDISTQSNNDYKNHIFRAENLHNMGFDVMVIGNYDNGFSLENLKKIRSKDIIINVHGLGYEKNLYIAHDDNIISFNNLITPILSNAKEKKVPFNIILTACYGEYAHNGLKNLKAKLPIGSKVITLSNFTNTTLARDFTCSEDQLNKEIELFKNKNPNFMDLLLLRCVNQTFSQNTPIVGIQTEKGYKSVSLDKIFSIPGEIAMPSSAILQQLFIQNIISEDKMKRVIEEFNKSNVNIYETKSFKNELLLSKDLTEGIKEIEKICYFENDLTDLNNFKRTESIKNYTDYKTFHEIDEILKNKELGDFCSFVKSLMLLITHLNQKKIANEEFSPLSNYILSCYNDEGVLRTTEDLQIVLEIFIKLGMQPLETSNIIEFCLSFGREWNIISGDVIKLAGSNFDNSFYDESVLTSKLFFEKDEFPPLSKIGYLHILSVVELSGAKDWSEFLCDDQIEVTESGASPACCSIF